MRRKLPNKNLHLDDLSYSALARSVATQIIRRMGADSDAISAVLEVVHRSTCRAQGSARCQDMYGKAFVDELLENAGISPRSGLPALRAPSTLQPHVHTIRRLALAAELRDDSTGSHIVRVGGYSALLAERLGLSDAEVRTIYYAALLHDVGKIGIPDRILKKRGKLSQEEFEIMKTHTIIGAKILADAEVEVLQIARHIAGCHHERWDGQGYPRGISAHGIPLAARIVALADTFDAITSSRPYRRTRSVEDALGIIEMESGKQFDPAIVAVFLANINSVVKIREKVNRPLDSTPSDHAESETGSPAWKTGDIQVDLDHEFGKEFENEF